MKIYFDVCCYNRPYDDYTDDRIEIESNAILSIMNRCLKNNWLIVGSEVVDIEISKIYNNYKRQNVIELASLKDEYVIINDYIVNRAIELQNKGIKAYDSLHLACAEYSNVDVFLTTDDKLIKKASTTNVRIKVSNPVNWFMEVLYNENDN